MDRNILYLFRLCRTFKIAGPLYRMLLRWLYCTRLLSFTGKQHSKYEHVGGGVSIRHPIPDALLKELRDRPLPLAGLDSDGRNLASEPRKKEIRTVDEQARSEQQSPLPPAPNAAHGTRDEKHW